MEDSSVMTDPDPKNETYSEAETEARREAALKRMLATPHKPQKAKEGDTARGKRQKMKRGN
mgnify:CR=1 FL=1